MFLFCYIFTGARLLSKECFYRLYGTALMPPKTHWTIKTITDVVAELKLTLI